MNKNLNPLVVFDLLLEDKLTNILRTNKVACDINIHLNDICVHLVVHKDKYAISFETLANMFDLDYLKDRILVIHDYDLLMRHLTPIMLKAFINTLFVDGYRLYYKETLYSSAKQFITKQRNENILVAKQPINNDDFIKHIKHSLTNSAEQMLFEDLLNNEDFIKYLEDIRCSIQETGGNSNE